MRLPLASRVHESPLESVNPTEALNFVCIPCGGSGTLTLYLPGGNVPIGTAPSPAISSGAAPCMAPVSYTHLDVYKRQGLRRIRAARLGQQPDGLRLELRRVSRSFCHGSIISHRVRGNAEQKSVHIIIMLMPEICKVIRNVRVGEVD